MNNNVVRKCANILSISERIKQLAKSWYKKSILNNSDTKQYITTTEASLGTPLAYINNCRDSSWICVPGLTRDFLG